MKTFPSILSCTQQHQTNLPSISNHGLINSLWSADHDDSKNENLGTLNLENQTNNYHTFTFKAKELPEQSQVIIALLTIHASSPYPLDSIEIQHNTIMILCISKQINSTNDHQYVITKFKNKNKKKHSLTTTERKNEDPLFLTWSLKHLPISASCFTHRFLSSLPNCPIRRAESSEEANWLCPEKSRAQLKEKEACKITREEIRELQLFF